LKNSFPVDNNHSLWKGYNSAKYRQPTWNGIHGSFWNAPLAAPNDGGYKIASPVPKPKINKIIAKDLPDHTWSPSSFDMPKRKDVIQINMPESKMKTVQYVIDPTKNFKPIKTGTYYHGIEPKIQKKNFGLARFMSPDNIGATEQDALNAAKTAEKKSAQLSSMISKHPLATEMVIPIVTTNLQEKPSLSLAERKKLKK